MLIKWLIGPDQVADSDFQAAVWGSIIIFLKHKISVKKGFPGGSDSKNLPAKETRVQSLSQEDLLEEEMATRSSTLAWRIPRTEEPGGLQSVGSQRVGHD